MTILLLVTMLIILSLELIVETILITPALFAFLGSLFRQLIIGYMRVQLHRGVPPLFTTLKPLYQREEKIEIIDNIVVEFIKNLEEHNKFHESGNPCSL